MYRLCFPEVVSSVFKIFYCPPQVGVDYLRVGGSSSQIHKEIEKHTISHLTSDVRSVSYLKDVYERKVCM